MSEDTIIINLKESRSATHFNSDNIIQKSALKEVATHIDSIVSEIEKYHKVVDKPGFCPELDHYPREHNTITISGGRGSGKTSFILSLQHLINENDNEELVKCGIEKLHNKRFSTLGLVDPTRVSTKEHILINVISRIKKRVEEYHKAHIKKTESTYRDWKKSLEKLARGISQLEKIGTTQNFNGDHWDDPMVIMDEGLDNAVSGFNLEFHLHAYIRKSLVIIDQNAFIIAFDDIDTRFEAGWPVLETIRMYLTTPQLVVILSGDLELFSTLIRNEQWKLFDKNLLTYDSKLVEKRDKTSQEKNLLMDQVDELEEQYLLKILPASTRVTLQSSKELSSKLFIETTNPPNGIIDYLNKMTEVAFYYKSDIDKQRVCEYLLSQPIRTLIQIMISFNDSYIKDELDDFKFNTKLVSIFLTKLQKQGYTIPELNKVGTQLGFNALAIKTINLSNGGIVHKFRPDFIDDSHSGTNLVVSRLYSSTSESILSKVIQYWIKVGICNESCNGKDSTYVKRVIDWLELESDDNSLQIFRKHLSLQRSNNFDKRFDVSSVRIKRSRGNITDVEIANSLQRNVIDSKLQKTDLSFFNNCHDSNLITNNRGLYELPFIGLLNNSTSSTVGSIINVISILPSLIDLNSNLEPDITLEIRIKNFFSHWLTYREYLMPQNNINQDDVNINLLSDIDTDTNENFVSEEIIKQLAEWIKSSNPMKVIPSPISLWANIWIRFTSSLRNMVDKQNWRVDEYFHRTLVILFNAVLYEETNFISADRINLSSKNPTKTDSFFIQNYKQTKEYVENTDGGDFKDFLKKNCPIFSQLFSCPIWGFYLLYSSDNDSVFRYYLDFISNTEIKSEIEFTFGLSTDYTVKSHTLFSILYTHRLSETLKKLEKPKETVQNILADKYADTTLLQSEVTKQIISQLEDEHLYLSPQARRTIIDTIDTHFELTADYLDNINSLINRYQDSIYEKELSYIKEILPKLIGEYGNAIAEAFLMLTVQRRIDFKDSFENIPDDQVAAMLEKLHSKGVNATKNKSAAVAKASDKEEPTISNSDGIFFIIMKNPDIFKKIIEGK
jgi:hypothetical protein